MNGLPEAVDLSFLRGRRLDQVCLGEYQVQLHFDEGVSVGVEGEFSLDGSRFGTKDGHVLHRLLGLSIGEPSRAGRGDLVLPFGSHVLVLHDSKENYESYTLGNGSNVIVV